MGIISLPTLYKRDTKGKIREWTIQYKDAATRTQAGIHKGNLVVSEWKEATAKNEGRANATTAYEQAAKEAQADWDKKVGKEYFEDIKKVDTYDKFKPQLAHDYSKLRDEQKMMLDMISQPKLDGIRCIARKDGLFTRAGKRITTCDHIYFELQTFFMRNPDAILDGELYNHDLREDFNKITSLVRKVKPTPEEAAECQQLVEYHVYDMAGDELFEDRMNFIQDEVDAEGPVHIVMTDFCNTQSELDSLYAEYIGNGFEGQMVRNNTPYENKRSKNLLKRKEFITEEFDVVEVLEGSGNWAGYAKHFTLELGDGRTFGSGVRGSQAVLKELFEQEVKPNWVTVRYFEKTPDGIPRFPVVIDWGVGERND